MTAAHVAITTRRAPARFTLGAHPVVAVLVMVALAHQLVVIAGVWSIILSAAGLRWVLGALALVLHIVTVTMVVGLIQWSRPRR